MNANEFTESYHLESFEHAFQKVKAQVSTDLATCATMLQRLLMAVDLFPIGGLYRGHYAEQAIRRYWLLWMPLLHEQQQHSRPVANFLVPPLDVQWAWFVHRLNPVQYLRDCTARFGTGVHPGDIQQALGFSNGSSSQPPKFPSRQQHRHTPSAEPNKNTTRQVWEAAYPAGPCYPAEHVFWPPAPPPPPSAGKRQKQCARPHLCQQPQNCQHLQQRQNEERQQQKREQQQQGQQEQQQQHPEMQENRHPPKAAADMLPGGDVGNKRDGTDGGRGGGGGDGSGCTNGGADESNRDTDSGGGGGGGGGDNRVPPSPPLPALGTLESVWSYVADAMVRQGRFAHQTLRYFYQDPDFLEAGRIRYLQFLTLLRTQPPGAPLLNPMYDQDVMWHSHLALSGIYVADCEAIMPVGRRPLGHDDLLSEATLANSFVFTLGRYEEVTGLMVNPSPTRRLPTFVAQPLAAQLWPLAAALADPRVSKLPTPRELTAELQTGGMQQYQHGTSSNGKPGNRCSNSSDGKGNDSSSSSNNMSAAANPASRSGVFSGDKDPPPGGGNRPPMLGSPDHLCRNGTFAIYALWNLAERLRLLSVAHTQQEKQQRQGEEEEGRAETAGRERRLQQAQLEEEQQVLEQEGKKEVEQHQKRQQQQQQQPNGESTAALGQGSSYGRQGGLFASCLTGSGTFASLPAQRSLRAAAAAQAGVGEEIGDGELDSALRHMTQQLLRLRDLSDPSSPLGSHQHPFWHHVTPLPPPPRMPQPPAPQPQHARNQEQQDQRHPQQQPQPPLLSSNASTPTSSVPASSSYVTTCNPPSAIMTAVAATGSAGGSTGNTRRRPIRRHPAPAPRIDLPSSFLPVSERNAESVYLARDQYAARGQVYYTPSDFCLLGDGRWCLPVPLAIEIAEREAAEADRMYDDDEQADINDHDDTARREGYCHRYLGRQSWWRSRVRKLFDSRGGDDSIDDVFFHYGYDHLRLYRNTLGHIVFSSRWPSHMARCYDRIYWELHRRRLTLAAT